MNEIFNKRLPDHVFMVALMRNIPQEYAPISFHGDKLEFHGENKPPEDVLAIARQKAIEEINYKEVQAEGRGRILSITRDWPTQIDFLIWYTYHRDTDNGFTASDLRIARAIIAWIEEIRSIGKRLINDPTYRDDTHWPQPPEGAKEFIERTF